MKAARAPLSWPRPLQSPPGGRTGGMTGPAIIALLTTASVLRAEVAKVPGAGSGGTDGAEARHGPYSPPRVPNMFRDEEREGDYQRGNDRDRMWHQQESQGQRDNGGFNDAFDDLNTEYGNRDHGDTYTGDRNRYSGDYDRFVGDQDRFTNDQDRSYGDKERFV